VAAGLLQFILIDITWCPHRACLLHIIRLLLLSSLTYLLSLLIVCRFVFSYSAFVFLMPFSTTPPPLHPTLLIVTRYKLYLWYHFISSAVAVTNCFVVNNYVSAHHCINLKTFP
jgi:hypothetical protein